MPFTTNARELAQRMERRLRQVDPGQRRANDEIAKGLTEESKALLEAQVYAVPVRRGKRGGPQWTRSRKLLEAEKFVVRGNAVVHENAMVYYRRRVRYGKPGGDRPGDPPMGIWEGGAGAVRRRARWVHNIRRRHFQESLRAR